MSKPTNTDLAAKLRSIRHRQVHSEPALSWLEDAAQRLEGEISETKCTPEPDRDGFYTCATFQHLHTQHQRANDLLRTLLDSIERIWFSYPNKNDEAAYEAASEFLGRGTGKQKKIIKAHPASTEISEAHAERTEISEAIVERAAKAGREQYWAGRQAYSMAWEDIGPMSRLLWLKVTRAALKAAREA